MIRRPRYAPEPFDTRDESAYWETELDRAEDETADDARDNADHNQRVAPLPWVAALPDPWLKEEVA